MATQPEKKEENPYELTHDSSSEEEEEDEFEIVVQASTGAKSKGFGGVFTIYDIEEYERKTGKQLKVPAPRDYAVFEQGISEDERKPWLEGGAASSDYFNYGLREETWKAYCQSQRQIYNLLKSREDYQTTQDLQRVQRQSLQRQMMQRVHGPKPGFVPPGMRPMMPMQFGRGMWMS